MACRYLRVVCAAWVIDISEDPAQIPDFGNIEEDQDKQFAEKAKIVLSA
eukprot:CAMPEP_0170356622 /NCGR_PEP_ID=MMETSP0117_2-20130122/1273_1 /TAXON_ID=400756 /ORGANISM="Durinskia baltica, Strain CSIRO CS-38" /LENGTH=48 /DNA_ID= /DNA_START= /DNA_END= /DNA_ORIENTATION=